jgi:acyl-CoA thioesterase
VISFDADTALEPIAEGRWRGSVPASWSIGFGPNGGFMAALAARAAGLLTPLPLSSLTVHYLEAPGFGPIEVAAEITRQGRGAAFARITINQDDKLVVQAGAVCTQWRDDTPAWSDATPPTVPEPDECVFVDPTRSNVAPLMANYDMRIAATDPGDRPPIVTGWIRTANPRPADRPLLAAYTDAFLPPAFLRAGFGHVRVPTLELTIHFRDHPPEDDYPWVIGTFTSRLAVGGTIEEDGELWSADGRLLAMSRQLSLIRAMK